MRHTKENFPNSDGSQHYGEGNQTEIGWKPTTIRRLLEGFTHS